MNQNSHHRIAWLLPVAWFYWQPAISEFTKQFPKTKVFTALFPGFVQGFEDTLDVRVVGEFKVVRSAEKSEGYNSRFTSLSPAIIGHLFQFKPQLIFSSSFGIWTILALLLKPIGAWKVVIVYEGSAPGVDFRNSSLRLTVRKMMIRAADACISNTKAGRTYLTKILQSPEESAFCQPFEIPAAKSLLENCQPVDLSHLPTNRPIFLFVGRIRERKGLHILLQSCSLIKDKGYKNWTVLVVGDGEQREELEQYCQAQNLDNNVHWLGQVPYDQIAAYFRYADVFVLPTKEDTWGVVILEAMLFGKAILCSTGAGSSELITDGENGYVFAHQDSQKLAELMLKFLQDSSLAVNMGEQSKKVMSAYTPEVAGQFLVDVTKSVMNPSNLS